MIKSPQVSYLN